MKKLGFLGGGNMAEALARGLIERKIFKPADLIASDVDAARRRKLKSALKIAVTDDNLEVVREAGALLLAVKPRPPRTFDLRARCSSRSPRESRSRESPARWARRRG
jgi:pyrroline-5-carboxylate reductase